MDFEYSIYRDSVEGNLSTALACMQFIASQMKNSKETQRKINNTKYANVMNLLLNSVQQDFLLCVTKIWDRNDDTLSLPGVLSKFDWDCGIVDTQKKKTAACRYRYVVEKFVVSDRMKSLRISRNEGFAHAIIEARERARMDEPRIATINDIIIALNRAIRMWNKFQFISGNPVTSYYLVKTQFEPIADQFFGSIPDLN